jgi:hypothetical protein
MVSHQLGWLRLPFISYSGWVLFYAGWQPNGFFGVKFNIKNSAVPVGFSMAAMLPARATTSRPCKSQISPVSSYRLSR